MNTPARKRGRPKKPPQEGPIISTTIRSQVTRTVTMGAYAASQFDQYIAWASAELRITKQHTMTVFLDRAIHDLLAKDVVWKQHSKNQVYARPLDDGPTQENEIVR